MRPKDIRRLPKQVTKLGEWKLITGKAKMGPGAFPLSKRGHFQLGRGWHWRVDRLETVDTHLALRLLTAFEPGFEEFRGMLACEHNGVHVLIASYEFHGTHPGWHCHTACCDLDEIDPEKTRPRQFVRLPEGNATHRKMKFDMTDNSALQRSFSFFNVGAPTLGELL